MAGRVGSDINALMQGGLEDWLASQNDMREGAKKQATGRWVWGAVILMPLLAFLWFSPAPTQLSMLLTAGGLAGAGYWGYRPIAAATQAIKTGINSAIAASYGLTYAAEVEPGPEFEAAVRGMSAGDSKTFSVKFPEDYHGKEVAGKEASFALTVKGVEEPQLPQLDAEFARTLGVADGDVAKMRGEVRANVEREVKKRVEARLKGQVMDALLAATPLELPKSLVEMEAQQLVQRAAADLQARGVKLDQMPLAPQHFEETAKRRVALGLVIAELSRAESLQPKPAEVRAMVEQEAQSYESPAEVVKWFYMQPQRLSEMEAMALEANVVKWVLSKAKVTDKEMAFDELMGSGS